MLRNEMIDLHEAIYRKDKQIKRNAHKLLALSRLKELREIDTASYSIEEKGLIENEIEDINLFLGRHQWQ
jgi:phosphate uptake regulator